MKSTATFKLMFVIIIACTLFACKKATDENPYNSSSDSTSVDTTTDTISTAPVDTTSMPAPGTPVDTAAAGSRPNQ
jgi:hypothetical protein